MTDCDVYAFFFTAYLYKEKQHAKYTHLKKKKKELKKKK
jgi:hypothetical protein